MNKASRLRALQVLAGGGLLLAAQCLQAAMPGLPSCMAGSPVPIIVRIGNDAARRAWLRGGASPALQIIDAESSEELWSAAASSPASQIFISLRAAFAGSLLPLDLDGDGVHDRIYAGDLAGRIWRFDLHHGLPAGQWATGGVFANFISGTRGFLAPPEVSLSGADFTLVAGTARLASTAVDNRIYVLRDRHPFDSWSQAQYEHWQPIREVDLVQLPRLGAVLTQPAPNGFFIAVGGFDILSPALTVSGRATLALADPGSAMSGACSVAAVVSAIDLANGRELPIRTDGPFESTRLALTMIAGERFTLRREADHARCLLGQAPIPACDVDLSPRRLWWRREDAD